MNANFQTAKHKKLNRMIGLRIMNWMGMVAWRETEHEWAKQHLRLMHPLSWLWFIVMFFYGVFAQGIPKTVDNIAYVLKHDTVWW